MLSVELLDGILSGGLAELLINELINSYVSFVAISFELKEYLFGVSRQVSF
jgi:hypothetical protein